VAPTLLHPIHFHYHPAITTNPDKLTIPLISHPFYAAHPSGQYLTDLLTFGGRCTLQLRIR